MSQQSVTFLSQASNCLHKQPKPPGGTNSFKKSIPVGTTLTLKHDTLAHDKALKEADHQKEVSYERDRPMRLIEFHYQATDKTRKERERLGTFNLPPKPVGSIPGYSGWVPRLEAANVIGCTYKNASLAASEIFAMEQEGVHARNANIFPPASDLETPNTLTGRP